MVRDRSTAVDISVRLIGPPIVASGFGHEFQRGIGVNSGGGGGVGVGGLGADSSGVRFGRSGTVVH